MKAIYLYDTTSREFQSSKLVDDNYVVQAGETEINPDNGLYEPVTWNGTTWIGTDKAVWQAAQDAANQAYLKEHPEEAPQTTAEQQALTALAQQIADNDNNTQTYLQSLAQSVTALATGTTKNGR
ncbi:hypothetical protein [Loigolactobacillus backii]|uniref:hypothetical protein n=1 Tax=Loigolactobacillus backii TaxID=375175 RepID=UPI0007F17D49|nr:hypothetical protein [Loigolactobacillus backii]ANK66601.1 hypothetical protein AYR55_02155 [Loigolactobacillus backii]OLF70821.1 hypothetical protein ACX53_00420 [Loigolactobacillus backii]PIO87311.1 hypothetical protein B8A32_09300 [Loigolactobacillus backii]